MRYRFPLIALIIVLGVVGFGAASSAAEILPFCTYTGSCQVCDYVGLFINLANWGLGILGSIALLVFIIGGVYLVVGGASSTAMTKGKEILKQAVVGMAIVLCAWLIVNFVIKSLVGNDEINGKKWYQAAGCTVVSDQAISQAAECTSVLKQINDNTGDRATLAKQYKEKDCDTRLATVRDGAPCTKGGDTINMVIYVPDTKSGQTECISECDYLVKRYEGSYKGYSCNDESSCDAATIERNLCPGGASKVCCKQGTTR